MSGNCRTQKYTVYKSSVFGNAYNCSGVYAGSLSVAVVIPGKGISLAAGIMQGFEDLLDRFSGGWLLPIMRFLVPSGQLAG
jgi:hypothetical protein